MNFTFLQPIFTFLAVLFLSILTLSYTFADNIVDNKYHSNVLEFFDFFDETENSASVTFYPLSPYHLSTSTISTISSTTIYQNSQSILNSGLDEYLNLNGPEYGVMTKVNCVNGFCSMKRQSINADQARDMHARIRENNEKMDAILKARFEAHNNYLNSMFFDK